MFKFRTLPLAMQALRMVKDLSHLVARKAYGLAYMTIPLVSFLLLGAASLAHVRGPA